VRYVIEIVVVLAVTWVLLLLALAVARPRGGRLRDMVRLMPDLIRMLNGLAHDRSIPRAARLRLWFLLAYLMSPIDLVPDIIPVLGVADDAIVAYVVLRGVVRRAGADAVRRHWPGDAEGCDAVLRLFGTA
jgi:uncharacterized membrane protein YkvA (DUF1232 family)